MASNLQLYLALFLVVCSPAESYLRSRLRSSRDVAVSGEPKVEVIEKSSITGTTTADCMCELGSFWHHKIKQCVKQGGLGYECGFFPAVHRNFVCEDGLKCVELNTTVEYVHPDTVPASCKRCEPSDNCLTGVARQNAECMKETMLSGQACATVKVTDAEAVAQAQKCVTIEEAKNAMDLGGLDRVGPILGARIIARADQMALNAATEAAQAAAAKIGEATAEEADQMAQEEEVMEKQEEEAGASAEQAAEVEEAREAKAAAAKAMADQKAAAEAAAAQAKAEADMKAATKAAEQAAEQAAQQKMQNDLKQVAGANPQANNGNGKIVPRQSEVPTAPPPRKISQEDIDSASP